MGVFAQDGTARTGVGEVMQNQSGARWVARDRSDRLEARETSADAQDVSYEGNHPYGGNPSPPGYQFAERLSYESLLALRELGFEIRPGEISPKGGDPS